jgi:hypothetical protein
MAPNRSAGASRCEQAGFAWKSLVLLEKTNSNRAIAFYATGIRMSHAAHKMLGEKVRGNGLRALRFRLSRRSARPKAGNSVNCSHSLSVNPQRPWPAAVQLTPRQGPRDTWYFRYSGALQDFLLPRLRTRAHTNRVRGHLPTRPKNLFGILCPVPAAPLVFW